MKEKYFLSWSGGKDCCFSLYKARQQDLPVTELLTTVNRVHQRISMHGVRIELLQQQTRSIGLPLRMLQLPEQPSMPEYQDAMSGLLNGMKTEGFTGGVFGDIFLEDLKTYRETQMGSIGLKSLFPLWKMNSRELVMSFVRSGFKAIVVCVNKQFLEKSFCGRLIDESFINDLPHNVDPCGENGEFHSFVFDGPIFQEPVKFEKGEIVSREYAAPVTTSNDCFKDPELSAGFYFLDLVPLPLPSELSLTK
jgi:uncharacterized protein (TIGR00290 family)